MVEKDSDGGRSGRRKPSFAGRATLPPLVFTFFPVNRRVNTLLTSQTPREIEPRTGFFVSSRGKKNIFNSSPPYPCSSARRL